MKKRWQAVVYLLLYLLLLSFVTEFEIGRLFDTRSFLALLAGAFLLTLPFCRKGMKTEEFFTLLGIRSIDAGLIQVFLLVFIRLSDECAYEGLLPDLAMCYRPMLYAFCLRMILEREEANADAETEEEDAGKGSAGDTDIAGNVGEITTADCLAAGLTKREAQIALLVCQGRSNREIGQELFISETTVKKHLSNIFEKTGISKREKLREAIQKAPPVS